MSARSGDRLYQLLPAVHRIRDAARGEPLHALLQAIDAEFGRLQDDIEGLYDNWFIETCDEWVVSYIGDLLGVRPIRSIAPADISLRGYVANTLAYRRRKGTALVLEQLARDVTGWPAHAVEFFQRLATTQHMNHVRPSPAPVPDLRNAADAQLAGTAFGAFAHVPEMRRIGTRGGRYNVPNVGLFLWRLQSFTIGQRTLGVSATDFGSARRIASSEPNTFSFHPAGVEMPLFNVPIAEEDLSHLAEEHNVPAPLRPPVLARELAAIRRSAPPSDLRVMRADAPAFRIFARLAGAPQFVEAPTQHIYMCSIPAELELSSPLILAVAIDCERGRLRFPAALDIDEVRTCHAYGFPGDLGGGPYDRAESIHTVNGAIDTDSDAARAGFFAPTWQTGVSHLEPATTDPPIFSSLRDAISAWNARAPGETGVMVLMDSLTDDSLSTVASPPAPLEILVPPGSRLLIAAAQWPRDADGRRLKGVLTSSAVRPHVVGDLVVRGVGAGDPANAGLLVLNGLMIEGSVEVADGNLATLAVQHCTVVPGAGRLRAAANPRLKIAVERSILGGVDIAAPIQQMSVTDSMIEAESGSPSFAVHAPQTPCSLKSCTIVGRTHVQSLEASDCIFTGEIEAIRRQTGCVRFSFVPEGSRTSRRYRCQPQLAVETAVTRAREQASSKGLSLSDAQVIDVREATLARVRPLFATLRYGAADYGQLDVRCAIEIREGAEQGAEMGMYRFLQQPVREANLRTVLQEYLRFGLEAGTFFVT
jgi:hypothetical protein